MKVLGWLTHLGLAGRATPTAAERVRVPSQIKYVHQTMLQPSRLKRAAQLSVHSFRVWLACALLAAGATPEQIMLLLRWSSEAARKL